MKFLRSKRGIATVALILVILFLFRPGVYRLRFRIASSIGAALGRRVDIDNVRIHVLPQPGFDLEGLLIFDDPAFSHEPMVRAQEVSAVIRLRSLLRGRLEIARLSATEPSINLVRNHDGHWNLSSLLERSAHIPAAPTGKAPSEHRPAFPYLEAVNARINFKLEQEKKPYALSDADVALWQESENSWGARMKAEPVRTDFNLTDTGLLAVNAIWQRAADLHSTPLQVSVAWQNGQLGQVTKLLSGKDRGWRGGVSLFANLSGTPDNLLVQSQITVSDFHRYDIMATEGVRLASSCTGRYNTSSGSITELLCNAPVTSGTLKLSGNYDLAHGGLDYDLNLVASEIPITSLLRVLRQAKKQLPSDLTASGTIGADVHAVRKGAGPADVSGEGEATNVRLLANASKYEVAIGNIPLTFVTAPPDQGARGRQQGPTQPQMRIGNFPLPLGGTAAATGSGWISASGYRFTVAGDAALRNLFRLADTVGIGGARPAAQGTARVALGISGSWQGFAPPATNGSAQLRNVRTEMRGLNVPVEISSAVLNLTPDSVSLEKIVMQTGVTHWTGSVRATRPCAAGDCMFQFDLSADQLSTSELNEWFTAHVAKRPWYRVLNAQEQAGPSPLVSAKAAGTLRVGRLEIRKFTATQLATQFELDRGKIKLNNLRGQLLQGTHVGNWTIDVVSQPPHYQAAGTLQNISLAQVSALTNDSWVTGTGDAKFEGTSSGFSLADVLANTNATINFTLRNGSFPRVASSVGSGPFSVHKLTGDLRLDKKNWELSAARLESRDGIYQVSGRASAGNGWNFKLHRNDDQSWLLSGTLAKPHMERTKRTQAEAVVAGKP